MIQAKFESLERIQQGDILSNVEHIEAVTEHDGIIKISKIVFPLVMVLTQDCDLTWDYDSRNTDSSNQDKYLFSAIVVPLYNYEHFVDGQHLSDLQQQMSKISRKLTKTDNKNLRKNEAPRYHYLEFEPNVPIVNSVIDFKHYFTVNNANQR